MLAGVPSAAAASCARDFSPDTWGSTGPLAALERAAVQLEPGLDRDPAGLDGGLQRPVIALVLLRVGI